MALSKKCVQIPAIDTFVDTSANVSYVIVGRNNTEGTSEITEATVVTTGTQASRHSPNYVPAAQHPMLTLHAVQDGSKHSDFECGFNRWWKQS